MARSYWLVKSEPFKYSWDQFVKDGATYWDGVRNYEARNNLQSMQVGDLVLFYHSGEGKEVVGIARITGEAYSDPTTEDDRWVVVDLKPVASMKQPVPLATFREDPTLSNIALLRRSRLSVVPVTRQEFDRILRLGKTRVSRR